MVSIRPDRQAFTLRQLAQRVGMVDSRARTLKSNGALPEPDLHDADGRPLWFAATIDHWARGTGRSPGDDASWIFTAPPPAAPAELQFHGIVNRPVRPGGRPHPMHAVVWGTAHGTVVYLTPVDGPDGTPGQVPDEQAAARLAAELVPPRLWDGTIVLLDYGVLYPKHFSGPWVVAFELVVPAAPPDLPGDPDGSDDGVPEVDRELSTNARDRLLRLLDRPSADAWGRAVQADTGATATAQPEPQIHPFSTLSLPMIANALGTPVPIWVTGTRLPEAIERARAWGTTMAVPDTASTWPMLRDRFAAAIAAGMPAAHPAAFTLLAADTSALLGQLRTRHQALPAEGEGWYLAARPAAPALPLDLEVDLATAADAITSLQADQIHTDLIALRQAEPQLPRDAPEGPAFAHARTLLTAAAEDTDPALAADDIVIEYGALVPGEATDTWLATLTPHPDPQAVWATRRGAALLRSHSPAEITELLTDGAGRLVAILPSPAGGQAALIEWPTAPPSTWGPATVIAAEHGPGNGCGQPLALTRTADGWHAELVPIPPPPYPFGGFSWGYVGTGPGALYDALMRAALGNPFYIDYRPPADSQLWKAITTTTGALRLPWPTLTQWAQHDAEHGGIAA